MNFIQKIKNNARIITQVAFTALTNGYVNGYIQGKIYQGPTKKLCVPGLNCYSCPGAMGSCPIGSLQAVINSPDYKISFYVIGWLMAIGAFLGRFVCGWLCPFGLVQDLLYKIPFFKKLRSLPGEKYLNKIKYIILAVFVILMPMFILGTGGVSSPWFCKLICPAGTLFGGIPLTLVNESLRSIIGFMFNWKVSILIFLVLLSILLYRPFCRYICPLGAIYSFFNSIALYRFEVDENKCIKCKLCQKACGMDIRVWEKPNSMECIRCGACLKACPTTAISIKNLAKKANLEEKNDC